MITENNKSVLVTPLIISMFHESFMNLIIIIEQLVISHQTFTLICLTYILLPKNIIIKQL